MNLNRALIVILCILSLLVIVTAININNSNSKRIEHSSDFADYEPLMTNVWCVPEIIRSYENVKEIYGKKNILFFRYINNSCNSCFNSQLNEILVLQEEIGKKYVWIFSAHPDDRNSMIQLSSELAKYNYRNIPADSLLIPTFNGEQKSYFAWINGEGDIGMVFIPDGNNVYNTRQYFLEIKSILKTLNES